MALLRQSQDTDAARLAAAQAEFNEKKWVWVPDDREGYLAGWVIREENDLGDVVMAAGGEVCSCRFASDVQTLNVLLPDEEAAFIRTV